MIAGEKQTPCSKMRGRGGDHLLLIIAAAHTLFSAFATKHEEKLRQVGHEDKSQAASPWGQARKAGAFREVDAISTAKVV